MRKLIFLFVLLVCFFNGFSQNNSNKTQNYGYVGLQKNDPKFLALMDTAQKYLPRFIDSLSKYKARPTYYFLIKSNFNEKDKNEHMWSKPLNYEKGIFTSVFIDSAFILKNIKTGDIVKIDSKKVEDWIIEKYPNKIILGNFSEPYLKEKEK